MYLTSCCSENKVLEKNGVEKEESLSNAIPKIDSAFLHELSQQVEIQAELSGETVAFLSSKLNPLTVDGHFYKAIPEFLRIDSLKKNGLYEDYLTKMDIGFLQNAEAYLLKKLQQNSKEKVELWFIKYSSYEACPYYHGIDIFLSLYEKETLKSSIQIGSIYNVIDPPMAFESILESYQKENQLLISLKQELIEMEEHGEKTIEENKQEFIFNLSNGTFQE